MATDFTKLFTSLGLSQTETKIYLSALSLGPSSVQDIAKSAKVSRTATYDAIATLQEHGLLSTFEKGKKKYFAAEDPESALDHFKSHIQEMEKNLGALSRVLPELKMKMGGERPVVKFFEGKDAVYSLFNDVAKVNPQSACEVANYEDVSQFIDMKTLEDARKGFDPGKINFRMLHRGKHPGQKHPKVEYCELLPELGDFHGDIWIYDDRVVFVTFIGKISAVRIEHKAFADTARVLFEAAWRICSKKR